MQRVFAWRFLAAAAAACALVAASSIDCDAPSECSATDPPVCGSDGTTYASKCEFEAAYCADPRDSFTMTPGACELEADQGVDADAADADNVESPVSDAPSPDEGTGSKATSSSPAVLPPEDETNLVPIADAFCDLTCKLVSDPVCGSDGETYINDCHLLASKCEHPELEKAAHGACPDKPTSRIPALASAAGGRAVEVDVGFRGRVSPRSDEDDQHLLDGFGNEVDDEPEMNDGDHLALLRSDGEPARCNPMCPRVYDPVCGSNGKTYANACLLEYGMCRDSRLFKFSDGKCPPSLVASQDARAFGHVCVPEPCDDIDAPVCGSDGQTHASPCMFASARCVRPQLTVLHDGPCDSETVLTCATMTCPTFTECKEEGGERDDDPVVAYCADVCSPERCGERETCELIDSECFTAPCSPVATCVPNSTPTAELDD